MKLLLYGFVVIFLLFCCSTKSQETEPSIITAVNCFNSFQKHKYTNSDSSIHYIKKLASFPQHEDLLADLVHSQFALCFYIPPNHSCGYTRSEREIALKTLKSLLKDTCKVLIKNMTPLHFWVQIQERCGNVTKLKQLLDMFVTEQLYDGFYEYSRGKYALLIYQAIADNPKIEKEAINFLQVIINKLDAMDLNSVPVGASVSDLKKRAWHRYIAAVAYGFKAINHGKLGSSKHVETGLERAARYSPDLTDNTVSNEFTRMEMNVFFGRPKTTFKNDYFQYLVKNNGDKKLALNVITELAMVDVKFKNTAQTFYNSYFSSAATFDDYWVACFNQNANQSDALELKTTSGEIVSSKQNNGKWIFVDFWGTWCGPCRYEHPAIEKFYKQVQSQYSDRLNVLTVACRDDINKVTEYMKSNKYSFPVAMADNTIENNFKVSSYPTKILISPQGKYIVIPFNSDWVNLIKQYANL